MRTNAPKRRGIVHYVLGFFFGSYYGGDDEVLLIRKRRPRWMRGKLNGVGGLVQPGETPLEAMTRALKKETGLVLADCPHGAFATLRFAATNTVVVCFTSSKKYIGSATTMTDEKVDRYGYPKCLQSKDLAPHVRWLLPLAVEYNRGITTLPIDLSFK